MRIGVPGSLPPVRRPLSFERCYPQAGYQAFSRFFESRDVVLLQSGTASLALAMSLCQRKRPVSQPEMLLPAYACPDLVSACLRASVTPRLVDVQRGRWSFEWNELSSSLGSSSIGIVAVNFLGLGDSASELAPIVAASNVQLIQDSAQFLPSTVQHPWPGDYIVLSFGRGKPMNLLRGGALVMSPGESVLQLEQQDRLTIDRSLSAFLMSTRMAGAAFNAMTYPPVYRWTSRLPGMRVGETVFKPIQQIKKLPFRAWGQVGAEFANYQRHPSYDAGVWAAVVEGWRALGIQPVSSSSGPSPHELLRLPLLAPDLESRDRVVSALSDRGLGASRMYVKPLHKLSGIPRVVAEQGPFPNAEDLADRLFTLPTYGLVSERIVEETDRVVRGIFA